MQILIGKSTLSEFRIQQLLQAIQKGNPKVTALKERVLYLYTQKKMH